MVTYAGTVQSVPITKIVGKTSSWIPHTENIGLEMIELAH